MWSLFWLAGCEVWPRFSAMEVDYLPATGAPDLAFAADESRADFPDSPELLRFAAHPRIPKMFTGLWWSGHLGWDGGLVGGSTTFGCSVSVPMTYRSDLDFVSFTYDGGALCIVVAAGLEGDPRPGRESASLARLDCPEDARDAVWDVPLFALDTEDTCLRGEAYGGWAVSADEPWAFVPWVPPGDYAVYAAGVCGRYAEAAPCAASSNPALGCVPYDLVVAAVPSAQACANMSAQIAQVAREAL